MDIPETSKESALEVATSAPSTTAQGTPSAGEVGSNRAEGSKNPTVRLVPFQSMPQSTQEELEKELFDDPLLSVDNMKKLTDSMEWCFKYTKVNLILLLLLAFVEWLVISDQFFSCILQDVANRSFLKSHALYKNVDNRKTLEQQNALIAK